MSYSPSAYSFGGAGMFSGPPQSGVAIEYNPADALAFIEFSGLSAILTGSPVTAATLHLTGFSDPGTTAVVRTHGVTLGDNSAPSDWSAAWSIYQDYKTAAYAEEDCNGHTSQDFDVTAIVNELIGMVGSVDGAKILFILFQPSYAGGGVGTSPLATATLDITTGGGGGPSVAVRRQSGIGRGLYRGLGRR